jgi:hypothetical protein
MRRMMSWVALGWLAAANACGGEPAAAPNVKRVCEPGTGYSCVRGTCNGHQECLADGSALTKCVCDDAAGAAGSDGDAGQEGDAGAARR